MKDLPKVSAFPINRKLNNFQESFYGKGEERHSYKGNIINKINDIFSSSSHVFKSRVRIYLKDDIIERTIIGKTGTDLLTLFGEKVRITDILDIEKV